MLWRDAASVFRENGKYPSRGLKGFFMPRTAPLVIKGQNKRYLAPTEQNQSNKNTRPFCNIHGHLQIQGQTLQDCLNYSICVDMDKNNQKD